MDRLKNELRKIHAETLHYATVIRIVTQSDNVIHVIQSRIRYEPVLKGRLVRKPKTIRASANLRPKGSAEHK